MNVEFDEEAIRFLEKLPKEIRKRIYEKIMKASDNPYRHFERLVGRQDYKLRIGDYRAIADIDKSIRITYIGHRKDVYK
jgi:mRNA interferase RelE/StbE